MDGTPSPFDDAARKPDGTLGTGGTFRGLAERFVGVPARLVGFRGPVDIVDRLLVAVPGREWPAGTRDGDLCSDSSPRLPASDAGVEAALFLRLARVAGDLSKVGVKSVAGSMVVRRLPFGAGRFGEASAFGVLGKEALGFLPRSCIRLASGAVVPVFPPSVVFAPSVIFTPATAAWRSRRRREASALRSSG